MGGVGQYLLQVAVAVGAGSLLAPVIAALFTRQRTRAESANLSAAATGELTKAAGDVAKIYTDLMAAAAATSAARIKELEELLVTQKEQLRQHKAKLSIAVGMLEDAGLDPASIR